MPRYLNDLDRRVAQGLLRYKHGGVTRFQLAARMLVTEGEMRAALGRLAHSTGLRLRTDDGRNELAGLSEQSVLVLEALLEETK